MRPYSIPIHIPTVRHGDKRNHQQVTKQRGICVTGTFTEERFCGDCEKWRTIEGIMGVIGGCPICGRDW